MNTNLTRGLRDKLLDSASNAGTDFKGGRQVAIALADEAINRGIAALAIIFFAPFYIAVICALLISEGRPIFYGQRRIGLNGKHFTCLKFRTMAPNADALLAELLERDPAARAEWETNQKLRDDPRINCIGRFLRKSSLDELPQFWNVVRGDMALVGPRPIVDDEVRHYGKNFADYIAVKPGITGHWQVNGRSTTTYEQRVAMDVDYVRNQSWQRNFMIMFKTVQVVLTGRGAS